MQASGRRKYRLAFDSARFTLRPLVHEDAVWLTSLFTDPEVCRYLHSGPFTAEKARRFAEAIISPDLQYRHFGHWAIHDKATGIVPGCVELMKSL